MCYGGLSSLNVDDMWDLFEYLASYQWQCECGSESFTLPHLPMICMLNLHVWINLGMLVITILPALLMHVLIANFFTMIRILVPLIMFNDEQHEHFVSEIRDFGLLHETKPSLPIPRPGSSLYDDYESSLLLESNVVDDAPLTDPEEVFDLSFSRTPVAISISDSTFLASPLPLTQWMGLEMGEISRGDIRVLEDASLIWSKELPLVEPCLKEPHFEGLCGDIVMLVLDLLISFVMSHLT